MRAAIYARVSTTDQNCEMQLKELREYCQRCKWEIAGEYVDLGWSGAKASRPQFDRVMRDASLHKFDCVIVWKLDRWGRSVSHCLDSLEQLRHAGIRWIDLTNNLDTGNSNPTAALLLHILAAVAQFEREMIRERVNAGLRSYREAYAAGRVGKARCSRSGKNLPVGRPRAIFDRGKIIVLRKQGKSIREIARILGIGKGTAEAALAVSEKPDSGAKKAR
jgi:putative DNA-invertase from lambdoid prophage Rac